MKQLLWMIAITIPLISCTNKSALKKVLLENPEIIFDVIEQHPGKFMATVQKASVEGRKHAQKEAEEAEAKQLDEELKNPKTPEIAADRAVLGKRDASIVVVEYSDFQCPYCTRGYTTVQELKKRYGDKLLFQFKHLPLEEIHPLATPAAKRFEAIAMQSAEKAYKFHDLIFESQTRLNKDGEKFLDEMAKKAGADVAAMKKEMNSDKIAARLASDKAEATKYGIQGTPGFVVAGVTLKGAYPIDAFENILKKRGLAGDAK